MLHRSEIRNTMLLAAAFALPLAACDAGQEETEYDVGDYEVEVERDAQTGAVEDVDVEREWFDWGYDADYYGWDVNNDEWLDWDEYQAGWNEVGLFEDWDADRDTWLTEDEVAGGLFADWDVDRSGWLDREEYRRGARAWFDDIGEMGRYSAWDTDNDGRIMANEFQTAFGQANLYDTWNVGEGELLGEEEFARGVHTMWDTDNDGRIEMVEYRW